MELAPNAHEDVFLYPQLLTKYIGVSEINRSSNHGSIHEDE